ncbi:MAG: glycosyltransferase family 2 protein [Pseudomonadota bacterium]
MAVQVDGKVAVGRAPCTTTIIPCFDDPDGLRRATRSVRFQDEDCELIIVDDGSAASNSAAISEIGRICQATVIRLPRQSGPAAARNAGIEASSGRYVAFLDADDVWLPGKLALQRSEMDRRGLVFSYMRYTNVDGGRMRPMPAPDQLSRRALMRNTAIGCSTVMLCREFLDDRRFTDAPCEDFAFWVELLNGEERAYLIGEEIAVLRFRGGRSRNKLVAAWRQWRTLRGPQNTPLLPALGQFAGYAGRAMHKHWRPGGSMPAYRRIGDLEL